MMRRRGTMRSGQKLQRWSRTSPVRDVNARAQWCRPGRCKSAGNDAGQERLQGRATSRQDLRRVQPRGGTTRIVPRAMRAVPGMRRLRRRIPTALGRHRARDWFEAIGATLTRGDGRGGVGAPRETRGAPVSWPSAHSPVDLRIPTRFVADSTVRAGWVSKPLLERAGAIPAGLLPLTRKRRSTRRRASSRAERLGSRSSSRSLGTCLDHSPPPRASGVLGASRSALIAAPARRQQRHVSAVKHGWLPRVLADAADRWGIPLAGEAIWAPPLRPTTGGATGRDSSDRLRRSAACRPVEWTSTSGARRVALGRGARREASIGGRRAALGESSPPPGPRPGFADDRCALSPR